MPGGFFADLYTFFPWGSDRTGLPYCRKRVSLMKENIPHQRMQAVEKVTGTAWFLYALVGGLGGVMVLAMGYSLYLGNCMATKYTPLIDAAMEIKLEATTAHLWFEEILSGDRFEEIEEVKGHLTESLWYATAMLEGGENAEGTFIPLEDPVLRSEIEKVHQKIHIFRNITDQRYAAFQESGSGTPIDQKYDAIFHDFIEQADRVESRLQAEVAARIEIYKAMQGSLIAMNIFLLGVVLLTFHRIDRRRAENLKLIANTNADLERALDEVKTLQGIIPICSYCKNIRDEKGLWNQLELYIHAHSEAEFSHGICPSCYEIEMAKMKKRREKKKGMGAE